MRVLVHACCGPCSITVIQWLQDQGHEPTLFFFNPNIHPLAEYMRRREGVGKVAKNLGISIIYGDTLPYEEQRWKLLHSCSTAENLKIKSDDFLWSDIPNDLPPAVNPVPWLRLMQQNGSNRCTLCWSLRLEKTSWFASTHGFEGFTTSLLYSTYQNHSALIEQSLEATTTYGISFVYHDFRKFWQQGITLSKEMDIYRQPYCGCIFSEYDRYSGKLKKQFLKN